MPGCCAKISEWAKAADMFAAPVQLKYRGEATFSTVFGGCVSILLVVGFVTGFFVQLFMLMNDPHYYNYPSTHDYGANETVIDPGAGSTVAVFVSSAYLPTETASQARINFYVLDYSGDSSAGPAQINYDAVLCSELYADQIEAEKNNTVASD